MLAACSHLVILIILRDNHLCFTDKRILKVINLKCPQLLSGKRAKKSRPNSKDCMIKCFCCIATHKLQFLESSITHSVVPSNWFPNPTRSASKTWIISLRAASIATAHILTPTLVQCSNLSSLPFSLPQSLCAA